jgi:hypothetical protein
MTAAWPPGSTPSSITGFPARLAGALQRAVDEGGGQPSGAAVAQDQYPEEQRHAGLALAAALVVSTALALVATVLTFSYVAKRTGR